MFKSKSIETPRNTVHKKNILSREELQYMHDFYPQILYLAQLSEKESRVLHDYLHGGFYNLNLQIRLGDDTKHYNNIITTLDGIFKNIPKNN